MAFKTNEFQQITMDDRFRSLSPRTQRMVLNSWAKTFAEIVFPAINEERFAVLYSERSASRTNTPINIIIGALMLKEMLGLSDDELLSSICCDIRFQYALHTTSFKEQPVSDRTFSRLRERLYNYEVEYGIDILKDEMMALSGTYAKYLNLNSTLKRMDSLMIASNSKRMSRLEIVYTVVANAVRLLDRLGMNELLPSKLQHYLHADDLNEVIYFRKSEDVAGRLNQTIADALALREIMADDQWQEFQEYRLLLRVLREQATEDSTGTLKPKDKAEIRPDSLQNPSDPDATYRRKAGKDHKGYVGNIVETVGEKGCTLINDVGYATNSHSDSAFCKEYIDQHDGKSKETLLTDGAYSGEENTRLAQDKGIELITTALLGRQPDPIIADFVFSEDGRRVVHCPMNHEPTKSTYYDKTESFRVIFEKKHCEGCANSAGCKVKFQRKTAIVMVSRKMVARAEYAKRLSAEEYRILTRQRNGVEGIPSVLRRKYHVDHIPARGLLRSKTFFLLKVGAYNIKKLLKYLAAPREQSAFDPIIV